MPSGGEDYLVIFMEAVAESDLKVLLPVILTAKVHLPAFLPLTLKPDADFVTAHVFDFVVTLIARPSVVFAPFAETRNVFPDFSVEASAGTSGISRETDEVVFDVDAGADELLDELFDEFVGVGAFVPAVVLIGADVASGDETDEGFALLTHSV